jgi:hypothetical protein
MESLPSKEACPFCQQLIDRNLINDHIMCHQVENEEEFNKYTTKNPYGNVINNSSQSGDINSNNISNNNNINNNPNNDDTAKLKRDVNLLKALIEINNPSNNGQTDYNKVLNILSGKSNENNNKSLAEDTIHTLFEGISAISNQFKDVCNQYNSIMGGGNNNNNNNNNMGSSNVTNISNNNPVSTNKPSFNNFNNSNAHQNNNQINENEINLIMECLSTDILNEKKVGENSKCLMCNEHFNIGQSVTTLPCSHVFHFNCIKSTLKYNNKCPNCQFEISLDNIIK